MKLYSDDTRTDRFTKDPSQIKYVLDGLLMMILRDVERGFNGYKTSSIRQYVIFDRLLLREMKKTGVVKWNANQTQMEIDYDPTKFSALLESMKDVMFRLKDIYELLHEDSSKDTDEDKKKYKTAEDTLVKEIEEDTEVDFAKVYACISVKK
jgi:hypothetical protein